MHKGHRQILQQVKHLAESVNGESIVITFHPHPRITLQKSANTLRLLTSLNEKIDKLAQLEIDHLVVVPFDESFASQTPESYIEDFLIGKFSPAHIVIGYDHKFGKNREGNMTLLQSYLDGRGTKITQIQKQEVQDIAVSSTKIREALNLGKVNLAKDLLGASYTLRGKVVDGEKIGKGLGYPTANIQVDDAWKLIPGRGIYAVRTFVEGQFHEGMMYIGTRPSIEHLSEQTLEVNLFDFNGDLYGKDIQVIFDHFSRDDKKFDDFESLSAAIAQDEINIRAFYNEKKKQHVARSVEEEEVAIVILNYNGADHLQTYLPSVRSTVHPNARIIVVDNCSTDQSTSVIKEHFPHVELMLLEENFGFTGGYARALQLIDSPILVLLNSDVRVQKEWLKEALEVLNRDPKIAVVQPRILSDVSPGHFEYAGAAGGWLDKWGYPFCRGRLFDSLEPAAGNYLDEADIFWASGCAFVIRNEAYQKAGGLDPQFFAHLEEIDLCWRLQRMGYQIKYAPKSMVYHLGGGTLNYQSPRKTFLNFRNSLFMIYKNKKGTALFGNILIRLLLDGVAGIKFLLSGKFADCWAIIKAHFSFYKKIGALNQRKRLEAELIQKGKIAEPTQLQGWYTKSIVYQYYIKGIKKFSDLT